MSYKVTKSGERVDASVISCDARKGTGICGNRASVTMSKPMDPKKFLLDLGWRLLRGHQVCASCQRKKRVTFPRTLK